MLQYFPQNMAQQENEQIQGTQLTPVDKLRQLEEFITDGDEVLYDFGRFLADRINPELMPLGFVNAVTLAVYDLKAGVDGFTGQRISGTLASLPDILYSQLPMSAARIAKAVYPEDFAKQVEAELEVVYDKAREKSEPKGPEIDHAAVMPGKDPFEMLDNGERIPTKGIFVNANLWKGSHGIFKIYRFNNFSRYNLSDSRPRYDSERLNVNFDELDEGSKQLHFAYEQARFVGKNKPPYDRGDTTTYIGFSWEDLDIIDMPSQGRLLIVKKPWNIGYEMTSFDKNGMDLKQDSPRREVFSYFEPNDSDGAISCIEAMATKLIGLSPEDAKIMGEAVRTRLFSLGK